MISHEIKLLFKAIAAGELDSFLSKNLDLTSNTDENGNNFLHIVLQSILESQFTGEALAETNSFKKEEITFDFSEIIISLAERFPHIKDTKNANGCSPSDLVTLIIVEGCLPTLLEKFPPKTQDSSFFAVEMFSYAEVEAKKEEDRKIELANREAIAAKEAEKAEMAKPRSERVEPKPKTQIFVQEKPFVLEELIRDILGYGNIAHNAASNPDEDFAILIALLKENPTLTEEKNSNGETLLDILLVSTLIVSDLGEFKESPQFLEALKLCSSKERLPSKSINEAITIAVRFGNIETAKTLLRLFPKSLNSENDLVESDALKKKGLRSCLSKHDITFLDKKLQKDGDDGMLVLAAKYTDDKSFASLVENHPELVKDLAKGPLAQLINHTKDKPDIREKIIEAADKETLKAVKKEEKDIPKTNTRKSKVSPITTHNSQGQSK